MKESSTPWLAIDPVDAKYDFLSSIHITEEKINKFPQLFYMALDTLKRNYNIENLLPLDVPIIRIISQPQLLFITPEWIKRKTS